MTGGGDEVVPGGRRRVSTRAMTPIAAVTANAAATPRRSSSARAGRHGRAAHADAERGAEHVGQVQRRRRPPLPARRRHPQHHQRDRRVSQPHAQARDGPGGQRPRPPARTAAAPGPSRRCRPERSPARGGPGGALPSVSLSRACIQAPAVQASVAPVTAMPATTGLRWRTAVIVSVTYASAPKNVNVSRPRRRIVAGSPGRAVSVPVGHQPAQTRAPRRRRRPGSARRWPAECWR